MPACHAMAMAPGQKAELTESECALRKDHKPWDLVAIGLRALTNEAVSDCSPIYPMQKIPANRWTGWIASARRRWGMRH